MKKCLIFLLILLWAGVCFGATYYVDKRCTYNGDGTTESCAAGAGQAGAFNSFTSPLNKTVLDADGDIIEVVAGSGPYGAADCQFLSLGYFYPNQSSGNTITWNFNNNKLRFDVNVNDGTYEWHQSGADATQYYLTGAGAADPSISNVTSCVVDDNWNDEAMNLDNSTSYKANNWRYGDFDTLGFSTLYVKYSGGDPTNSGIEVWMAQAQSYCMRLSSGIATFVFNDLYLSGSSDDGAGSDYGLLELGTPATFNRCYFFNGSEKAVNISHTTATGSEFIYCVFHDAGHRGIEFSVQADITVYNSTFHGVHLAAKFTSDTAYTITWKNNIATMLYAGGVQYDVTTPTFTESNNLWFIDADSTHGGKAIAYNGGNWTTTAASDLPASTATSNAVGTDPKLTSLTNFTLQDDSPCINAGAAWMVQSPLPLTDRARDVIRYRGTGVDIGAQEK